MSKTKSIIKQYSKPIRFMSLMGLAMLLWTCSSDQVQEPEKPEVKGTPIAFNGNMQQEEVTRAGTSLHDMGRSSFKVWGYKNMSSETQMVMENYVVNWQDNAGSTTSNSNGWEYILSAYPDQTIKYWDYEANAYRFFAVTNNLTGAYNDNTTKERYVFSSFTADATNLANTPYISRLWFSENSEKPYGQPVTLEFLQPFSKVRFMFTYVNPREGITLENKSFKPTNNSKIGRKGTVTVSYPLKGTETTESITTTPASPGDEALNEFKEDYDPDFDSKVYTETENGWYTVFPCSTQGSYTLSVSVNGAAKTATVPDQYMRWLPGYSYTYIFKITDEGGVEIQMIQASATTNWIDMSGSHTVYNW